MMKDVTIGIDIGGTHFRIGPVAVDGSLSGFEKISSGKFGGVDGVSVLVDEVRGYMERWKPDGNVKAVTIGIPGTVSRDKTTVFSAPYVPSFTGFDLKHRLEDAWGIPVFIERDANILMFGDMFFHREDICFESDGMLVGLYYGSAVANAFYFRGQFYDGKNGVAGEIAHNPIRGLDERCVCGNIGCQCLRCGGKYLERLAAERYPDTAFEQLFLAHGQEAPVREFVKDMAVPVIEIANILDPELIFIAGGVTDMAGFPWGLLEQDIRENTRHPMPADSLRFIFTTHSRESGVLGAGLYGAYRLGLVEL